MLTQLDSMGRKPKICSRNTFLSAHQEGILKYDYEYQSAADNCKLREQLASYGNGSRNIDKVWYNCMTTGLSLTIIEV